MKQVLVAAIAAVIGILVGAAYPLAEVRSLQARLDSMSEQDCARGVGTEIASMFQGRPFQGDPPPIYEPEPDDEPLEGEDDEPEPSLVETDRPDEDFVIEEDPEGFEDGVAAVKEAMELRRVQARAALVEDAWPDDEQLEDFDAAVDRMNDDLFDLAEQFVAELDDGDEPTRREAMIFAADALDVLITADEDLEGTLDPEQLDEVADESIDPFSYVDPRIVDVLASLDQ